MGVWDVCAVAVQALLYAATLGAAGGVLYLTYSRRLLDEADRLALSRPILLLMLVALAASAARIAVTAASLGGGAAAALDTGLWNMVWQGGEGRALSLRAAGFLCASPALVGRGRLGAFAAAGAALAASSFAWVGHTHAIGYPVSSLLIGVHLIAAAFWIGALAPLHRYARAHQPRQVALVAGRFGRAALVLVSMLAGAGVLVLGMLLGRWSALGSSAYGETVCVKLALVAALLACAAYNKLALTPRLARGEPAALRSLRRSIAIEMVLAGLILLVTAVLTTQHGPPES